MSGTTKTCHAISETATDTWCNTNCNHNPPFCPAEFCACVDSGSAHTTVAPAVHKTTVTPAVQPVNCEFQWGAWSPCSKPCDGGQQSRSPNILRQAQHGGNACPSPQTRACNTAPCPTPAVQPVNCEFQWGAWSPCSKPCDGGQQSRSPNILRQAQHGGNACPSPQTRACNTAPCPCTGYCAAPAASSPPTTEYPAACYPGGCATATT